MWEVFSGLRTGSISDGDLPLRRGKGRFDIIGVSRSKSISSSRRISAAALIAAAELPTSARSAVAFAEFDRLVEVNCGLQVLNDVAEEGAGLPGTLLKSEVGGCSYRVAETRVGDAGSGRDFRFFGFGNKGGRG